MKWFKFLRKKDKDIKEKAFLRGGSFKDYKKLEGNQKIIVDAIEYTFSRNRSYRQRTNLNIYAVTEERLLEYKNGFKGNRHEKHMALVIWMAKIGLNYETDRDIVSEMIRGIYEYTKGKLDYRNAKMRKNDIKKCKIV